MGLNLKRIIYLTITILIVTFIFYNSLQNGEQSSNASTIILNFINEFFANVGLKFRLEGFFLRKIAHFLEFFVFGIFAMLTLEAFFQKVFFALGYTLFFATAIPVIDEYIQTYSIGRVSSVQDILIDFAGAIVGIILVCIGLGIKYNKRKNRYRYRINY